MSFHHRTPLVVMAAPVVALLVGGSVGWFMRGTDAAPGTEATVVGAPLPSGAALDAAAPATRVPTAPNSMVVDRFAVVGYPQDLGVQVPKGAAVPLSDPSAVQPVDARTLRPVTPSTPAPLPPVQPTPLTEAVPPATPPSTTPVDTTTTLASEPDPDADPCTTSETPCAGHPGVVLPPPTSSAPVPDPLLISVPFAATGAYAAMCGAIEGDTVPDPFLVPAVRPTIAVVVNQPSSIALTGTWDDGTPLDKVTMVSSPEHEQQWQQDWDTKGVQGSILACFTLPLDEVRLHAEGGRAALNASLFAISANGQAQADGGVTVNTPLDGEDAPFADQLTVGALGEQRRADGTLVPTVHVHYALVTDELVPLSGRLDERTAKVYAEHALVENADCSGWANNAQGVIRTSDSWFTVAAEQRTVAGREQPVTVVDGDLELDPALPGGWDGFACTHLFVADADGNRVTLALRGAEVRSPMTAVYDIGVVIADLAFPDGWRIDASWSTTNGALWCGPTTLDAANLGGTCTTFARAVPDGVVLSLQATDDTGERRPAFVVTVPVNAGYCTPDDPLAALSDGCDTGFTQTLKMPVEAGTKAAIAMTLQVHRTALAGSMQTNAAHAWLISVTQAFAF